MMRYRPARTRTLLAAICALLLTGGVTTAANPDDTYTWSAELVGFDEAARVMTVKSLVVGREVDDWSAFDKGDSVMLTWSGVFSASGVRRIAHENDGEGGRFTMPVEFVSTEHDNRYVIFRVPIPEDDASAIEGLQPGDWVTATSPRQPAAPTEVVASIRPYTSVG